jgi:hypothetical protein
MRLFSRRRLAGACTASLLIIAALGSPAATHAASAVADAPVRQQASSDGAGDDGDAQPTDAQPTDAQPTDGAPTGAAPTEGMDDGFEGEVVYDPFFVSPDPDDTPAGSPATRVVRSTDRPGLTPPATDTPAEVVAATGGSGVLLLLAGLAALSITVFALGRVPGTRAR